jgi:regulatory protein
VADADPLDLAARSLRHRDRSTREVEDRLARAGVDADRRAETIETLARLGYVDDARFAAGRAADLAGRGWGDEAIRLRLEEAGVGVEEVEAALAGLEPERERAAALVARDGASPRTARRLLAKGFAEDVVARAVGENIAEADAADV